MVPFLEHLNFFGAALRIVELEKIWRMDFDIFFLLLVSRSQNQDFAWAIAFA